MTTEQYGERIARTEERIAQNQREIDRLHLQADRLLAQSTEQLAIVGKLGVAIDDQWKAHQKTLEESAKADLPDRMTRVEVQLQEMKHSLRTLWRYSLGAVTGAGAALAAAVRALLGM